MLPDIQVEKCLESPQLAPHARKRDKFDFFVSFKCKTIFLLPSVQQQTIEVQNQLLYNPIIANTTFQLSLTI